jgi:hypothetical protein
MAISFAEKNRGDVERLKQRAASVNAMFDYAEELARVEEKRIARILEELRKHGVLP